MESKIEQFGQRKYLTLREEIFAEEIFAEFDCFPSKKKG